MVVSERLVALLVVGISLASAQLYSSQWAAHIEGGYQQAQLVADKHGFTLLAQIFPDYYHLEHRRIAKRSLEPSIDHHQNLLSEKQVKWAEQQRVRRRVKRDQTEALREPLSPNHVYLNDPRWPQMWYLNRGSGLDMGVEGAWLEGITGKGIVVTILDDGLEKDHPDLQLNYDPEASYDVNSHDENPSPRYDLIDSNRHGTRCAGEVAAVANNSLCSVGIAYKASVGGVRMLDGDVTDAVEARSLSLNSQHIDIYSASWGPDDDGKTVDGPGGLATRAFIEGVTKGRSGKGSIFVWASGNGGRDHDNCNCDGYTNSIWTLSISSATENGLVPWYSEACSSTLATTYSSGSTGEKQIVTTDLHHGCTSSHTGTSASAPLAAGICALALEANRALTWRDMQHIVVATARPANLKAPDWTTNGVGRNVSHSFGYGLMDAAAMVRLAKTWKTVPEQHKCEVLAPQIDKMIPAKSSVTLQLNVKDCSGVSYLEHVQAKITLQTQRRGDVEIQLVSPVGTRTTLLARRPQDTSRSGFRSWPFMSVHTWGESPFGLWTLEIHNEGKYFARLSDWNLIFYGTEVPPMSSPDSSSYGPPKVELQDSNILETKGWGRPSHTDFADFGGSPCTKWGPDNTCIGCLDGFTLLDGQCINKTSIKCRNDQYRTFDNKCNDCHYSCYNCTGSYDHQCSSCHHDSYLTSLNGQNYCISTVFRSTIDDKVWLIRIFIILSINLVLLIMYFCFTYLRHTGCNKIHSQNSNAGKRVFSDYNYSQNLLDNFQKGYSKISKQDDLSDNE